MVSLSLVWGEGGTSIAMEEGYFGGDSGLLESLY